jgi:hypothetical protein
MMKNSLVPFLVFSALLTPSVFAESHPLAGNWKGKGEMRSDISAEGPCEDVELSLEVTSDRVVFQKAIIQCGSYRSSRSGTPRAMRKGSDLFLLQKVGEITDQSLSLNFNGAETIELELSNIGMAYHYRSTLSDGRVLIDFHGDLSRE